MAGSPNPNFRQSFQLPNNSGGYVPNQYLVNQFGYLRSRLPQQVNPWQPLGFNSRVNQPIIGFQQGIQNRVEAARQNENVQQALPQLQLLEQNLA